MADARRTARLTALLVPLALSACTTLGPDFVRPTVPWLAGWSGGALRTLADDPARSGGPQTDEWWRHFNGPVLDQLVSEAQRLNPGVRTAGLRILEARAQLGIAGSALDPQLQQVTGELVRTGRRDSDGNSTSFSTASAGFDLAWELDFWGRFKRGVESADAAYFASIAQYDDLQVLMAAQVASLYGSIRTLESRLRIAHENAAIQQRSLEITELLFRSGHESELDVQQARSLYLSTLATIPELRGSLRQAHNALSILPSAFSTLSDATMPGDWKNRTCTTSGSSGAIRMCRPPARSSIFSWWRATAGIATRRSDTSTPVASVADVFADAQVIERGIRVDLPAPEAKGGTIPTLRSPIVIDGTPMVAERPSPRLGAHTQEVLVDPAWGG